jgi:hypothetical protein
MSMAINGINGINGVILNGSNNEMAAWHQCQSIVK